MKTRVERLEEKILLTIRRIKYGTEQEQRKNYQKLENYNELYVKLTGKEFRINTD